MKKYFNVNIEIKEEQQEIALAALSDLLFEGIVQDEDMLIVTFEEKNFSDELLNQMKSLLSEYEIEHNLVSIDSLNDKNWNEEFEKKVPAIHVSKRIGIAPTWKFDELNEEIKIKINPKMSFGTGEHSTTRLVAQLMGNAVQPNSHWIDAGTGTGILAILAIKLGAKTCFAFDNYEWSVENAAENIALNEIGNEIDLQLLDIDEITLPEADGIAANIFTSMILKAMPLFYESLKNRKGDLISSGILKYDRDLIVEKAEETGFELIEERTDDEWIAFHFRVK